MLVERSRRMEFVFGIVLLAAIAFLLWISWQVSSRTPMQAKHYTLIFDNVAGLEVDNPVLIAGVRVGAVDAIDLENSKARVHIAINKEVELHKNASGQIAAKSLLGEKYLALSPGDAKLEVLAENSRIVGTAATIDMDQVVRQAGIALARFNTLLADTDDAAIKHWFVQIDNLRMRLDKMVSELGTKKLDTLLLQATALAGTLNHLLSDPVVGKLGKEVTSVLENANKFLKEFKNLDEEKIRQFLQIEGIRIRLLTDPEVQKRVDELKAVGN